MINDFRVASRSLLELLFPTLCVVCKKYGELVCYECFQSIHINDEPFFIYSEHKVLCAADYKQRAVFKIIGAFKYGLLKNLDKYCAKTIYDYLIINKLPLPEKAVLTFVPMYHRKESLRGFNQTRLIAEHLAVLTERLCLDLLTKTRHTKAQMLLNREERKENLRGCFKASDCQGMDIILIDDVVTTGATLKECAEALSNAGARSVTCVAFCKD